MLEALPIELVHIICNALRTKRDQASLCLTSKHMYRKCVEVLYKDLIVPFSPESNLAEATVPTILTATEEARRRLLYVRHIHFVADIHQKLMDRCPHRTHRAPRPASNVENTEDKVISDPLRPLAVEAFRVLRCLPRSRLRSFSWELGTCLPYHVAIYLKQMQPQIEELSFIGCADCGSLDSLIPLHKIDPQRTRLKKLSCRAFVRARTLRGAGRLLEANANTVEEFVLDATEWTPMFVSIDGDDLDHHHKEAVDDTDRTYVVPWLIFRIGISMRKTFYPALRHLSFTAVNLMQGTVALAWAFNFVHLRKLTLIRCPGTVNMLAMLSRIGHPLHLRYLEIVADPFHESVENESLRNESHTHAKHLARLLRRLPYLEDLYVMNLERECDVGLLWRSLLLHQSQSLRRLVFHQPAKGEPVLTELDEDLYNVTHDVEVDRLCDESHFTSPVNDLTSEIASVLSTLPLTSLGLREPPERLLAFFASVKPRPSLRFFHLRNFARKAPFEEYEIPDVPELDRSGSDYNNCLNYYDQQVDECNDNEEDAYIVSDTGESDTEEWEVDDNVVGDMAAVQHRLALQEPKFGWSGWKDDHLSPGSFGAKLDLLQVIHWMFSLDGLPKLEVVALGEFCHGERNDGTCRFFGRASNNEDFATMEEVSRYDPRYQDLILDNMEMLRSCPNERLLYANWSGPPPPSTRHHYPGRL